MGTKKLSQVLKDAPEATSLALTDRILGCSQNGSKFGVSRQNLMKQTLQANMDEDAPSTGRWVRILNVSASSMGMVCLTNTWQTAAPSPCCFIFLGTHKQNSASTRVLVLQTSAYFRNLRVVYVDGGVHYIEVFVKSLEKVNVLNLSVSGNLTVPDSFTAGNVPTGATVKEFDLTTSVFGGG